MRQFVLAGLAAIVSGLAVYFVLNAVHPPSQQKKGAAHLVFPVSREEALIFVHSSSGGKWGEGREWVQLVKTDGKIAWEAELTPVFPTSIAATDDSVVILGQVWEDGTHALALSRATGQQLWKRRIAEQDNHYTNALKVDEDRVYVATSSRPGGIHALALSDGTELWSLERKLWDHGYLLTLSAPGRLRVPGPEGVTEVDGKTGAVIREHQFWYRCAIENGIIASNSQGVFVVRDGEEAPLQPVYRLEKGQSATNTLCGVRGNDLVIGTFSSEPGTISVARVDIAKGTEKWRLSLDNEMVRHARGMGFELPRFVALADPKNVTVLDLDAGTIANTLPCLGGLDNTFVQGSRTFYVHAGETGTFEKLSSFDPSTGQLERATRLQRARFVGFEHEPRASAYEFGLLWLRGDSLADMADLDWAVIDLETGKLVHKNGRIGVTDAAAEGWSP